MSTEQKIEQNAVLMNDAHWYMNSVVQHEHVNIYDINSFKQWRGISDKIKFSKMLNQKINTRHLMFFINFSFSAILRSTKEPSCVQLNRCHPVLCPDWFKVSVTYIHTPLYSIYSCSTNSLCEWHKKSRLAILIKVDLWNQSFTKATNMF